MAALIFTLFSLKFALAEQVAIDSKSQLNQPAAKGISRAELESKYTDKVGVEWSAPLSEKYSNGCKWTGEPGELTKCENNKEIDLTSTAFAACEEKGWMLPSREDWFRLAKEFDHKVHPLGVVLTGKGEAEFTSTFAKNGAFASTKIANPDIPPGHLAAFAFSTSDRGKTAEYILKTKGMIQPRDLYSLYDRHEKLNVICIRKPMS
jgi:hypothetical protein